jgi:hypothetical protein
LSTGIRFGAGAAFFLIPCRSLSRKPPFSGLKGHCRHIAIPIPLSHQRDCVLAAGPLDTEEIEVGALLSRALGIKMPASRAKASKASRMLSASNFPLIPARQALSTASCSGPRVGHSFRTTKASQMLSTYRGKPSPTKIETGFLKQMTGMACSTVAWPACTGRPQSS